MHDLIPEYSGAGADWYDYFELGQPGDIRFYRQETELTSGEILELGCGTGRVLIPIAQLGRSIVGLDRSSKMLGLAIENISQIEEIAQKNIELVESDMRSFSLGRKFGLITIPNRSFLHLLTHEDQRSALERIREHLQDDGRLIFNIPDPHLESIAQEHKSIENPIRRHAEFINPKSGNTVIVWVTRNYDLANQLVKQLYIFDEISSDGLLVNKYYTSLKLRLSFRYEMQHLLELSGFRINSLYGGFKKQPFEHGREQIWIVQKA